MDIWVHISTAAGAAIKNLSEVLAQPAPKAAAVERQHTDTRQRVIKQQLPLKRTAKNAQYF